MAQVTVIFCGYFSVKRKTKKNGFYVVFPE